MFNKLFGAPPPKVEKVDPSKASEKLDATIENINIRITKIEKDVVKTKQSALTKMKAGQKQSAAFDMKRI